MANNFNECDATATDVIARADAAAAQATANNALAGNPPAGALMDYAGTVAPAGWLACPLVATDIDRATYADLFAAIGTTWGVGDGVTTFGMPWFAADYAAVQSNANVGTASVGQVIAHVHGGVVIGQAGGNGGIGPGTPEGVVVGNTASTGGAANLAAGVRVFKCVKI